MKTNAERQAEYRARNRDRVAEGKYQLRMMKRSALATLKLEAGCADCGYAEYPEALDFDHVRGEKVAGIAWMLVTTRPMDVILDEIEKCEVVCANCHRHRNVLTGVYGKGKGE